MRRWRDDPVRTAALAVGAGRITVGVAFLRLPVLSVRMLGLDTASATRVTFLARMTAARDAALGAGTLHAVLRGRDVSAWLLAGAACDAADATLITLAARSGRLDPVKSAPAVAGAAATAAVAVWAARGAQTSRVS